MTGTIPGAVDRRAYRPFMAAEKMFQIGLAPLDMADWIECDRHFADELKVKETLLRTRYSEVFACLPGSRAAQQEVLDALIGYLTDHYPSRYRKTGTQLDICETGRNYDVNDFREAPLDLAGRIVQEDLCILEWSGTGYCLTAASLCAPAYWRLGQKIGKPLMDIHQPVPGWQDGLGPRVDRIFDRLRCESPVWRLNWSIVPEKQTFTPDRSPEMQAHLERRVTRGAGDQIYLRVERQTLVRMPRTQAILFTIRTYVTRLDKIIEHPATARSLRIALAELGEKEKTYKDINEIPDKAWDRLLGSLN